MSSLTIRFLPPHHSVQSPRARVAVIVHAFYIDLLGEISTYLGSIPEPYDLYVTVCDARQLIEVQSWSKELSSRVSISIVENRGRDVLPFLRVVESASLEGYVCVLKLHTKRSLYSETGSDWRNGLLAGLLPSRQQVGIVLDAFGAKVGLGLCAPMGYFLSDDSYWGGNRQRVGSFAEKFGLAPAPHELLFVAGTMFWFSPPALSELHRLMLSQVFEAEAGQRDGTVAHAYERLVCSAVHAASMRVASVEAPMENLDRKVVATHRIADASR